MKIKITKPDGTVIEAEGTAEECAKMMGEGPTPYFVPSTWSPWWAPAYPTIMPYPWGTYSTGTVADGAGATSTTSVAYAYPPGTSFSFTGASS